MMRLAAISLLLLTLAAPPARGQPNPAASQPPDVTKELAGLARLIDQSNPGLRAAPVPEALTAIGKPPRDPSAILSAIDAKKSTPTSCATVIGAVEAWADWGERIAGSQTTLVGLPGPDHVQGARIAARSTAALAAVARAMIDTTIDQTDRAAPMGGSPEQDEELLPLLHARQVTLPLRAARAAAVLSASEVRAESRTALARSALALARAAEPVSAWAEAERSLIIGHAALAGGSAAESLEAFAAARRAVSAKGLPTQLAAQVNVEAALGSALALARERGPLTAQDALLSSLTRPPFIDADSRSEPAPSLLGAQTHLRIARLLAASTNDESRRRAALQRAFDRFAELLSHPPRGVEATVWRSHVYESLAPGLEAEDADGTLAPVAAMARVRGISSDPAHREESLRILRAIIARSNLQPRSVEADARLELAILSAQSDRTSALEESVALFTDFAERFADDSRAPTAIALACAAADRLVRADPSKAELYLATLRHASTSELAVPAQDAWRLALARFRSLAAESQPPTLDGVRAAAESAREADVVTSMVRDPRTLYEARVLAVRAWSAALIALQSNPALDPPSELDSQALGSALSRAALATAQGVGTEASPTDIILVQIAIALSKLAQGADFASTSAALQSGVHAWSRDPGLRALAARGARGLLLASLRAGQPPTALAAARSLNDLEPQEGDRLVRLYAEHDWKTIEPMTIGPVDRAPRQGGAPMGIERAVASLLVAPDLDSATPADRMRRAWALLVLGAVEEAAPDFRLVLEAEPGWRSARLGLGEALLAAGDDAGAFAQFRDLAAALEAAAERSADYFHAWTRMLEILARQNKDGARTQTIQRECKRLLLTPEVDQCALCRPRLAALARAVGGTPR